MKETNYYQYLNIEPWSHKKIIEKAIHEKFEKLCKQESIYEEEINYILFELDQHLKKQKRIPAYYAWICPYFNVASLSELYKKFWIKSQSRFTKEAFHVFRENTKDFLEQDLNMLDNAEKILSDQKKRMSYDLDYMFQSYERMTRSNFIKEWKRMYLLYTDHFKSHEMTTAYYLCGEWNRIKEATSYFAQHIDVYQAFSIAHFNDKKINNLLFEFYQSEDSNFFLIPNFSNLKMESLRAHRYQMDKILLKYLIFLRYMNFNFSKMDQAISNLGSSMLHTQGFSLIRHLNPQLKANRS